MNNLAIWDDPRLTDANDDDEDEEAEAPTRLLSVVLASLDVAILSTVDQLGADVSQIATLFDETLKGLRGGDC